MKKVLSVLLVSAMTLSLLAGCSQSASSSSSASSGSSKSSSSASSSGQAVKLVLWHDKGDSGMKMFSELSDLFAKEHPNVTIESTSFPSAEFIQKSISAINTNSAPDIIWNDYHRILPVEQQTSKLVDVSSLIPADQKQLIDKNSMNLGNYGGKQVVYPNESAFIALGIRKSWMDKVGGKVPETWDDFVELGKKFTTGDPDGNGKNDTFGYTAYFGKGSLECVRYFDLAAGVNDVTVNADGNPSFNETVRKQIMKNYASLYNTLKIVPEDAVSHTYVEMYQLIEGGKAGMFRVGDWNLKKWEGMFPNDIILTSYPVLKKGDKPTAQLYSMRGAGVPQNSPHKDLALEFAKFMNTKEAQLIHYKYQAGVIRNDLEIKDATTAQNYFLKDIYNTDKYKMVYPDTHAAKYPYVSKIEEIQEKAIQQLVADKNANVDKIMTDAYNQAAAVVKTDKK